MRFVRNVLTLRLCRRTDRIMICVLVKKKTRTNSNTVNFKFKNPIEKKTICVRAPITFLFLFRWNSRSHLQAVVCQVHKKIKSRPFCPFKWWTVERKILFSCYRKWYFTIQCNTPNVNIQMKEKKNITRARINKYWFLNCTEKEWKSIQTTTTKNTTSDE